MHQTPLASLVLLVCRLFKVCMYTSANYPFNLWTCCCWGLFYIATWCMYTHSPGRRTGTWASFYVICLCNVWNPGTCVGGHWTEVQKYTNHLFNTETYVSNCWLHGWISHSTWWQIAQLRMAWHWYEDQAQAHTHTHTHTHAQHQSLCSLREAAFLVEHCVLFLVVQSMPTVGCGCLVLVAWPNTSKCLSKDLFPLLSVLGLEDSESVSTMIWLVV